VPDEWILTEMNLSASQLVAIDEQLFAGDMIAAIRDHRRFTSAQLVDAKAFIDLRLEQLRRDQPSRFPITLSPPTLNPQVLQQIVPFLERDLGTFRSTLRQIEKLLYGINYAVTLSVSAAKLPTSDLPVNEMMSVLYPESTPHSATILPVRSEELVTDVTECLTYNGDASSGPQFTAKRFEQLSKILIPSFWQQLSDLAPLESSTIFSYSSDAGLPGYNVFWFFAYLVHHSDPSRCIVITGMSSD
jgi:hypothetical protein